MGWLANLLFIEYRCDVRVMICNMPLLLKCGLIQKLELRGDTADTMDVLI